MNEETDIPTFEMIRGRSWIDLTLCNNILAQKTRRWNCAGNESCSDHNLIRFDIEAGTTGSNAFNHTRKRYHIKTEDWGIFENKLVTNLLTGFGCANIPGDHTKWDEDLGDKVKQSTDTEELLSKFTTIITATSDAAFKVSRARDSNTKGRSVPWWTNALKILRKRALALRRRYQRTRIDDNLQQERKLRYQEEKRHFKAKLQEGKLKSWKDFCSCTAEYNTLTHTCTHTHTHLRLPVHTHAHTLVHTHTHAHAHTHTQTHTRTCASPRAHTHTPVPPRARAHTHTHTCTHTHTHTHKFSQVFCHAWKHKWKASFGMVCRPAVALHLISSVPNFDL